MGLFIWRHIFVILVASTLVLDEIECGFGESDICDTGRFRDISTAINCLHDNLISTAFEEKCKKYAIFSDKALAEKYPLAKTVLDVSIMGGDELNHHYDAMSISRIGMVYMTAIDRYRVTRLAPALIDLAECLRRIDTPEARAYLANSELILILDLYKQVLDPSVTMIDLRHLDITKHRPAFGKTLKNLFGKYLNLSTILEDTPTAAPDSYAKPESMNNSNVASASGSMPNPQNQPEERLGRKRIFESRRRERSCLMQRRLRIVKADEMRKKHREYQRERWRRDSRLLKSDADLTPDMIEAKRIAREKRDQANERRREKRRKIREDKLRLQFDTHQEEETLEQPIGQVQHGVITEPQPQWQPESQLPIDLYLELVRQLPLVRPPVDPIWPPANYTPDYQETYAHNALDERYPTGISTVPPFGWLDTSNAVQDTMASTPQSTRSGGTEAVMQFLLDEPQTSEFSNGGPNASGPSKDPKGAN